METSLLETVLCLTVEQKLSMSKSNHALGCEIALMDEGQKLARFDMRLAPLSWNTAKCHKHLRTIDKAKQLVSVT